MSAIIQITKDNFDKVQNAAGPVLLDFYTPWCRPCQIMAPILEEIAQEEKDSLVIFKIDASEELDIATKFNVTAVPNLILLENQQIQKRIRGSMPKEKLLSWIQSSEPSQV